MGKSTALDLRVNSAIKENAYRMLLLRFSLFGKVTVEQYWVKITEKALADSRKINSCSPVNHPQRENNATIDNAALINF